jgi:hypothetical protein
MNQGSLPGMKITKPQPSPLWGRGRDPAVAGESGEGGSNRPFSKQPLMLPAAPKNHESSLAGSKSPVFSIGLGYLQVGSKRQKSL